MDWRAQADAREQKTRGTLISFSECAVNAAAETCPHGDPAALYADVTKNKDSASDIPAAYAEARSRYLAHLRAIALREESLLAEIASWQPLDRRLPSDLTRAD